MTMHIFHFFLKTQPIGTEEQAVSKHVSLYFFAMNIFAQLIMLRGVREIMYVYVTLSSIK